MQKLLIFTDIHITSEGERIIGLDPVARFASALDHALARHPDAARIVLTGDLTHHGRPDQYDRLRTVLAGCPLPISMMIGNHDHRATFRAAFPDVPVDEDDFVQSVIDLDAYRLILLDTVNEGAPITHSGLLCTKRMSWLEARLNEARDTPTLLFLHHPPMATGFAGMDHIGLRNRADVAEKLRAHPQVCQIVAGHVHRTISGATGGIPTAIFKSPCHQMPMDLTDMDSHLSIDEPGAYGIILLGEDGVVVHSEDVGLNTHTGRDGLEQHG